FPVDRIDRGGVNLDENFVRTRCGTLHFHLRQDFWSAVLMNSYRFHNHFHLFVFLFAWSWSQQPSVSIVLHLLQSAQYCEGCAAMPFRHNGRERWNYGICDILW